VTSDAAVALTTAGTGDGDVPRSGDLRVGRVALDIDAEVPAAGVVK